MVCVDREKWQKINKHRQKFISSAVKATNKEINSKILILKKVISKWVKGKQHGQVFAMVLPQRLTRSVTFQNALWDPDLGTLQSLTVTYPLISSREGGVLTALTTKQRKTHNSNVAHQLTLTWTHLGIKWHHAQRNTCLLQQRGVELWRWTRSPHPTREADKSVFGSASANQSTGAQRRIAKGGTQVPIWERMRMQRKMEEL